MEVEREGEREREKGGGGRRWRMGGWGGMRAKEEERG